MKITVRCTSARIAPSDASGFLVDAEVADRTEILRQAVLEMTEAEIDSAFGKENTDRAAERVRKAIDIATLEAENAKLRDLLRRINASTDAVLTMDLWFEIKSAIEPSGNPGELGEHQ